MFAIVFFEIAPHWSRKEARKISRSLIKEYFGIENIEKTREGKPRAAHLCLSFSYTKYLGCVAVCSENIGVDLEYIDESFDWKDMLWIFAKEKESIIGKAKREQKKLLYRLWTMKEAYLKFLGRGFLIAPQNIEIDCQKFLIKNQRDVKIFSELIRHKDKFFSLALATKRRVEDEEITSLVRRSLRSLSRRDSDCLSGKGPDLSCPG